MAVDGSDSFHLVNCQKDISNFRTYHLGFVFLLVIFYVVNHHFSPSFWENMFGSLFPNHLKSKVTRKPVFSKGHLLRFLWKYGKIRRKAGGAPPWTYPLVPFQGIPKSSYLAHRSGADPSRTLMGYLRTYTHPIHPCQKQVHSPLHCNSNCFTKRWFIIWSRPGTFIVSIDRGKKNDPKTLDDRPPSSVIRTFLVYLIQGNWIPYISRRIHVWLV